MIGVIIVVVVSMMIFAALVFIGSVIDEYEKEDKSDGDKS